MRILKPIFTILVLALIIFGIYQYFIFPVLNKNNVSLVYLIDPDSLLVRENGKVHLVQLIGADAPELTGPNKDRQCYDYQARRLAALKYFGESRSIKLVSDPKAGDKDINNRDLRYVYLSNNVLYNEELIKDGLAKESNPQNKPYKEQADFFKSQTAAQNSGIGIWNFQTCRGRF
jgi:micrococcal nuclease